MSSQSQTILNCAFHRLGNNCQEDVVSLSLVFALTHNLSPNRNGHATNSIRKLVNRLYKTHVFAFINKSIAFAIVIFKAASVVFFATRLSCFLSLTNNREVIKKASTSDAGDFFVFAKVYLTSGLN